MKFLKCFLRNLWLLIKVFLAIGLASAAFLAPAVLASELGNGRWLWLYVIYGIPLFALFITWMDMGDDD